MDSAMGRAIVGWRGYVARRIGGKISIPFKTKPHERIHLARRDAQAWIVRKYPSSFGYQLERGELKVFVRPVYGPDPNQTTLEL